MKSNRSVTARLKRARIKYDQQVLKFCANLCLVIFLWLVSVYIAGHVLAARLLGRL